MSDEEVKLTPEGADLQSETPEGETPETASEIAAETAAENDATPRLNADGSEMTPAQKKAEWQRNYRKRQNAAATDGATAPESA